MESENSAMRMLHRIQRTVPDRDFFMHSYRRNENDSEKKKGKGGLFSGLGRKKKPKFNLIKAREKIRAFHNAFLANVDRSDGSKNAVGGDVMSISEMNAFRQKIRESADADDSDANYLALDGVIKYIDLKNSAITTGKQAILLDSLRKIGSALLEDGGLSMFHTTWFLSCYKEYLARYKMFPKAELEQIQSQGGNEANAIAKRLARKQFEIPHYLQLVDDKVFEMKQLNQYSTDILVKMSRHGQVGCTANDIKNIFREKIKEGAGSTTTKGKVNEVSIVMAYAMAFARIPMMDQLVENIRNAIPNINTDTILYKQKIVIAQKITLLEIARALHQDDGSENFTKKLTILANSVFNYCVKVVKDNQLDRSPLKNDIYVHSILKQAVVAITYKNIFRKNQDAYLKLLDTSKGLLEAVKPCASSGHKAMRRLASHAEVYTKNINNIINQVKSEDSAGYGEDDFGRTHQNF
jgi:hypothetical protein